MKAVLEMVSLQLITSPFVYHRHYSHVQKLPVSLQMELVAAENLYISSSVYDGVQSVRGIQTPYFVS